MGQICKPFIEVDNASLEYELNNTTLGKDFYFRTMFPLKQVSRFNIKTIEGDEGLPVAAKRVAFNTKNPLFTRKDIGKREIELGKYAVSRDMDEKQIQEYRDLQAIAAASSDPAVAQEMVAMAYDDVRFCEQALPAKIEIDALGIGSLGKQVFNKEIDGDMATQDEIDFGVPKENFGGVEVPWTDVEGADGIADIINWQEKIAATGYAKPQYVWMEKKAYKQLAAQKKTMQRLFTVTSVLDVSLAVSVTLEGINNYMARMGYPRILVIESWVAIENEKGQRKNIKPWNENVITLSVTPQLGYTYWKRKFIEEAEDKVSIERGGEFYNITIEGERNPDKVTTSGEAYAQCGLIDRHSMCFVNVTKTTWNSGK